MAPPAAANLALAETVQRRFIDQAWLIPGIIDVQTVKSANGQEYVEVTIPDIFRGVAWEVTQLRCRIEDDFPSVTLNVDLKAMPDHAPTMEEPAGKTK